MEPFLTWLQNLSLPVWVAESDSIWGYAFALFVHAVGMGLTAGIAFVICLRLLGVGVLIPVSSLRGLFRLFWIGFAINLISGIILFMTDATGIAHVPVYYAKLICLALALVTTVQIRAFIDSDRSDDEIPPRIRKIAVLSIVLWLGVIATGRLIAYAVESAGSAASNSEVNAQVV